MSPSLSEEERKGLLRRIKWLLLLRVVILSFFVGATALVYLLRGETENVTTLRSLQFPLIAAYLFSVGSALALPWIRHVVLFAHAQVSFDVLLVTGVVSVTGGSQSPFPFLYNLAIMNGSILLFYRGALTTAGFSSVCYLGLLSWIYLKLPSTSGATLAPLVLGLTLNVPTFFIIAFLSGFLAHKLYETERLLQEKQREYLDLEALKEALTQGVGSGVAITDLKGEINYFNTQAQNLTRLGHETVIGKKLTEIFPSLPHSFESPQRPTRVAFNDFAYVDPDGHNKHLRLTLAPLSNPAQAAIGFVAIFEDITKQKEMEEKIRWEEEMRKARERELTGVKPAVGGDTRFQFEGVMGQSGGMDKIYQLIQKVTATNANVLITGESGTGKELVARAIHTNGPRRDRPFVAVNCGAIPENLMESELFGHVRGAFTGAVSDHDGLFKQADGGTVFLDEVGELPLNLQVKLLRVLQEKAFTPVGGSKQMKVDVRLISASNKNLRKEMENGRFREDLFYRLNVVQMILPPLRSRKEDIPSLTLYFIRKFARGLNKPVEEISSGSLMCLMNYSYPGNIRELENIIEHAVAVTNLNILTEDDLPAYVKSVSLSEEFELFEKTAPGGADAFFHKMISLDEELSTHEKCLLLGALKRAGGVQKKAAELLGINYRSFRHRMEKYSLLNMKEQGARQDQPEG